MAHVTHDNRMFFDHFLFHFFSVDVSIGGIGFVIEFFWRRSIVGKQWLGSGVPRGSLLKSASLIIAGRFNCFQMGLPIPGDDELETKSD